MTSYNIYNLIYESRISYIVQKDAYSSSRYEAFLLVFDNNHVAQAVKKFEMTILIKLTFKIDNH